MISVSNKIVLTSGEILFNKPVLEIIADNPYAGKETFFTFSDKSKDDEEAKFYLIKFLSHKEKLDDESIINGFKLGDHELCKVLAGFHGDIINQNKPLQEDYKFYCSLNEELRKLYPDATYGGWIF